MMAMACLLLQHTVFDLLVFFQPCLGVRFRGYLVPVDVVLHQLDRYPQQQPRDLHRPPQQVNRPVQGQLRRFFFRSRRVSVMNR